MKWKRVRSLSALLAFAGGVAVEREVTDQDYRQPIPDELLQAFRIHADTRDPESYSICFLADGRAIAIASQGTGPGYSEVTPDPQWAAESFFFVGEN